MKPPKLSSGTTGFYNDQNVWVCTGSQMGRRNLIPSVPQPCKMSLTRLRFVDGDYDQGGAYWGSPANLWRAYGEACHFGDSLQCPEVFVRANSRAEAKAEVLQLFPTATFYR